MEYISTPSSRFYLLHTAHRDAREVESELLAVQEILSLKRVEIAETDAAIAATRQLLEERVAEFRNTAAHVKELRAATKDLLSFKVNGDGAGSLSLDSSLDMRSTVAGALDTFVSGSRGNLQEFIDGRMAEIGRLLPTPPDDELVSNSTTLGSDEIGNVEAVTSKSVSENRIPDSGTVLAGDFEFDIEKELARVSAKLDDEFAEILSS